MFGDEEVGYGVWRRTAHGMRVSCIECEKCEWTIIPGEEYRRVEDEDGVDTFIGYVHYDCPGEGADDEVDETYFGGVDAPWR